MLVAIPLFGDEVSPRFEYATEVMIADISSGKVSSLRRLSVPAQGGMEVYSLILSAAPETVVCGGIYPRWQRMFEHKKIAVLWGVIGRAEDALKSYAAGELSSNQFVCSGRRVGGSRRRYQRGKRGKRFQQGGAL
jgi:predicted Fe-Mo cluster-binding NifX family protein